MPPKCIWFFLGTCEHLILNFFSHFKYIMLTLDLNYLIFFKNSNIYKLEHRKYICVEKIHITKYEKLQIYFKTKVVGEVL
jgi:hypothetical protein